jgi:hypothetical protein
LVEDAKICEDARKVGRDGLGLVGAEKEGGGDEVRLEEPKIFGENTREEAGGKGRGQTDGAQASEETVWNPAAPTEERADKETPAEASNRGFRRVARWGGAASGAGGGSEGSSGGGRGTEFGGRMRGCGRGSWTSTHLATSETAER